MWVVLVWVLLFMVWMGDREGCLVFFVLLLLGYIEDKNGRVFVVFGLEFVVFLWLLVFFILVFRGVLFVDLV